MDIVVYYISTERSREMFAYETTLTEQQIDRFELDRIGPDRVGSNDMSPYGDIHHIYYLEGRYDLYG